MLPWVTVVTWMSHDRQSERALAAAVGPHQGMRFAVIDRQVDSAKDRLVANRNVQVFYF